MVENADFIAGAEAMRRAILLALERQVRNVHQVGRARDVEVLESVSEMVTDEATPHQPATEPKPGTVRVRFGLMMWKDGTPRECLPESLLDEQDAPHAWITADLPIPQPVEVMGRVG